MALVNGILLHASMLRRTGLKNDDRKQTKKKKTERPESKYFHSNMGRKSDGGSSIQGKACNAYMEQHIL